LKSDSARNNIHPNNTQKPEITNKNTGKKHVNMAVRLSVNVVSMGVIRGGKGDSIPRVAESLRGRRKVPKCRKYFLQYQLICVRKSSGSNKGTPSLLLTPGVI